METKKFKINVKEVGTAAAKIVVGTAASFGTGFIISKYGHAVISPNEKLIKKGLMIFGTLVLSNMVGNAAEKYVDGQIDSIADVIENFVNFVKDDTSENIDTDDIEEVDNG